jgi:hypothetical protein
MPVVVWYDAWGTELPGRVAGHWAIDVGRSGAFASKPAPTLDVY